MDGGAACSDPALLNAAALGRLMPLSVWVAPTGHIRAVGPTLAKLCTGQRLEERRFLEVFEIRKPQTAQSMEDVRRLVGRRLDLKLREAPRTGLRGLCVALADGQGFVVNLSFGISAAEAVSKHGLTNADFAPTDLTVELLYLTEVKAAVMEELAALNRRLQAAQRAAEEQALTDALTGLANRRALDLSLAAAIDRAGRGGAPFALVHLDLDHFKAVNDTLGHAAGDLVLGHVARVLRGVVRKHDFVARAGGDEFVLILAAPVESMLLERIAARMIAGIEEPVEFEGKPCRISCSVGGTISDLYDVPDADRMLSDADTALYVSKRQGRARSTIYAPGLSVPEDGAPATDSVRR
ncbi:Diguanylate cyclase DosC [Defluviimonas aquaemixtae]|uniref:Diguanylate cyclase DosC n=1 Tax=Albidovulum aquaemixtae TaxID=1542388 RepID=A0A2R8B3J0_9RHOB|nr:GGDEF domain-containing protein [Defluviimonas aquaemixtae]SPH17189.1 Diguanylate cyclase DosC [Defluviimonas aquaemixtae]